MKRIFLSSLLLLSTSYTFALDPNASGMRAANELSTAFEEVAKVITPSVVSISSTTRAKSAKRNGNGAPDPFEQFREFFGDDFMDRFGGGGNGAGPDRAPQQSMGTGVIIDTEGHILTNNHVVEGADELKVRLHDDQELKAKVIGTDPRTDLAVIKINAKDLQPAELGVSANLRIGQWVVAAGNPFGLDNSITAGIISAKGRSLQGRGMYEDFIQTDAAINPGNSGGPLVNLEGKVIGINTAIFTRSGGYMGIGFAIPIDMARHVLESLIKKGKVVRGWLGVAIQPVTKEAAKNFGFEGTDGVLIGGVEPDGPAEKGGIKQGDIVISIDGKAVKSVNELRNIVAGTSPGKETNLEVFREGKKENLVVVIKELSAEGAAVQSKTPEAEPESELGILLQSVPQELQNRRGKKRGGVLVTKVRPGTAAETAGIRPQDIIISVNGSRTDSPAQFRTAVEKADKRRGLRLVVETEGMEHFVFLNVEE